MKVFRDNEDQIENNCESLDISEEAVDKEALFSRAVDKLDADVEYWDTATHVLTDDGLDPKAVAFVKDGFATGEGAVLQVPGTDVDTGVLLDIYDDVVGRPIGHEVRVTRHLPNPMEIRERMGAELEQLMGEEPEIAYTRHVTRQMSFNVKCMDGFEEYFAIVGEPEVHNAIPRKYVEMVQTVASVFRDMTSRLRIRFNGAHNLCGESLESYPMIKGSLPFKTRETGRKDGTGEIDRCF